MARDSQRKKVHTAIAEFNSLPLATHYDTPKDIEKVIKRLLKLAAINRRFPRASTLKWEVTDGRGYWGAVWRVSNYVYKLHFPRNDRGIGDIVMLVGKVLDRTVGNPCRCYNGWSACKAMLEVMRYGVSHEAADALEEIFKKHRIKFRKPIKRAAREPTEKQLHARRVFAVKARLYAAPNPDLLKGNS